MGSEPYYMYIEISQYVYAAIQSNQQYSSRRGVHAVFVFCTCTCSRQQHLKSVHSYWMIQNFANEQVYMYKQTTYGARGLEYCLSCLRLAQILLILIQLLL